MEGTLTMTDDHTNNNSTDTFAWMTSHFPFPFPYCKFANIFLQMLVSGFCFFMLCMQWCCLQMVVWWTLYCMTVTVYRLNNTEIVSYDLWLTLGYFRFKIKEIYIQYEHRIVIHLHLS